MQLLKTFLRNEQKIECSVKALRQRCSDHTKMNRDLNAIDWVQDQGGERTKLTESNPTSPLPSSPSLRKSSSQTLKPKELFSNFTASTLFLLGLQ